MAEDKCGVMGCSQPSVRSYSRDAVEKGASRWRMRRRSGYTSQGAQQGVQEGHQGRA